MSLELRRGVPVDIVTDQTSAHDPSNGYLPEHWSLARWMDLRRRDPEEVAISAREAIANHVRATLSFKAMGIPTSMFTAIFALARTVGWVAQWREMIEDPQQKIGRPRQLYTGAPSRDYVPISRRK